MTDAGGSQIQTQRRAQSSGANQQHSSALELELPFEAHLGHDEMPAISQNLFFGELYFLFWQRVGRNCHGRSPLFVTSNKAIHRRSKAGCLSCLRPWFAYSLCRGNEYPHRSDTHSRSCE